MSNKPIFYLRGFTLIELMITLAIATVLLSTALPSFIQSVGSNRLATNTNEFIAALNLARSESINRGTSVVVAKSGANWEAGWQVFVDVDTTPASDANTFNDDGDANLCEAGEDCVLKVYGALSTNTTLRGDSNLATFVAYNGSGNSNLSGKFVVCDNSDGSNVPRANKSRLIVVSATGRVSLGVDSNNDGIPNTDAVATAASNITSCTTP
ncbi:MAG: GspH/FimT family pseudopilin [Methylococcaceae bacterium]|jgi:type IV fimbrial biogenesis protein FimT